MGIKKKYEVYGGTILMLDGEGKPPRYHSGSRTEEPTVALFFARGNITQEVANKAAHRVMESTARVTNTRIQLCTRSAVRNWQDAIDLADSFVEELNRLLKNRDREVASRKAKKADSREGYNYRPPGHLVHKRCWQPRGVSSDNEVICSPPGDGGVQT